MAERFELHAMQILLDYMVRLQHYIQVSLVSAAIVCLLGSCAVFTENSAWEAKRLRKACDAGEFTACADLSDLYRLGFGVPQDDSTAAGLARRACDAGVAEGCYLLGSYTYYGQGTAVDKASALSIWEKACVSGDAESCGSLGAYHNEGSAYPHFQGRFGEPEREPQKALGYFEKACAGSRGAACFDVARFHHAGIGVSKNEEESERYARQAMALLEEDCAQTGARARYGCYQLGAVYSRGFFHMKADPEKAKAYMARACHQGSLQGCYYWAQVCEDGGLFLPRDYKQAAASYEYACDRHFDAACYGLARLHLFGQGVPKDLRTALALYRKITPTSPMVAVMAELVALRLENPASFSAHIDSATPSEECIAGSWDVCPFSGFFDLLCERAGYETQCVRDFDFGVDLVSIGCLIGTEELCPFMNPLLDERTRRRY
ncbi:MAG: tetratricopeptide repeat protein [Bdellovibrionota bacterium]